MHFGCDVVHGFRVWGGVRSAPLGPLLCACCPQLDLPLVVVGRFHSGAGSGAGGVSTIRVSSESSDFDITYQLAPLLRRFGCACLFGRILRF